MYGHDESQKGSEGRFGPTKKTRCEKHHKSVPVVYLRLPTNGAVFTFTLGLDIKRWFHFSYSHDLFPWDRASSSETSPAPSI